MTVELNDSIRKARKGNLVIYDIDYLLENLPREIYLLESYRKAKKNLSKCTLESVREKVPSMSTLAQLFEERTDLRSASDSYEDFVNNVDNIY